MPEGSGGCPSRCSPARVAAASTRTCAPYRVARPGLRLAARTASGVRRAVSQRSVRRVGCGGWSSQEQLRSRSADRQAQHSRRSRHSGTAAQRGSAEWAASGHGKSGRAHRGEVEATCIQLVVRSHIVKVVDELQQIASPRHVRRVRQNIVLRGQRDGRRRVRQTADRRGTSSTAGAQGDSGRTGAGWRGSLTICCTVRRATCCWCSAIFVLSLGWVGSEVVLLVGYLNGWQVVQLRIATYVDKGGAGQVTWAFSRQFHEYLYRAKMTQIICPSKSRKRTLHQFALGTRAGRRCRWRCRDADTWRTTRFPPSDQYFRSRM